MMNWRTLAAAMTLATGAVADHRVGSPQPVTVCLNPGANAPAVYRAQEAASRILYTAGVKLMWQSDLQSCAAPTAGIVIRLTEYTPGDYHPGAVAYAMPYERRTIVVLYDRVQAAKVPSLLAHVLVHELTHILQGVAVHSASEMMKPRWGSRDYADMRHRALSFSEEDMRLIHHGLAAREALK